MKYFITILSLFLITLLACTKSSKNTSSIIGRWKLTETLADPGNGSGEWMPATSDYLIQFYKDSSAGDNAVTAGAELYKYSLLNDSTIKLFYLNGTNFTFYFKADANHLTLMGECIEACGSKYIRTSVLTN